MVIAGINMGSTRQMLLNDRMAARIAIQTMTNTCRNSRTKCFPNSQYSSWRVWNCCTIYCCVLIASSTVPMLVYLPKVLWLTR